MVIEKLPLLYTGIIKRQSPTLMLFEKKCDLKKSLRTLNIKEISRVYLKKVYDFLSTPKETKHRPSTSNHTDEASLLQLHSDQTYELANPRRAPQLP
jgi:hypothetical protein